MTLFLTNLNVYGLVILPPAVFLSLSCRTIASVFKILILSLVLQLLWMIIVDSLLSLIPLGTSRSSFRLVLELALNCVLDPLMTLCFCYFALHNSKVNKMLGVRSPIATTAISELEKKCTDKEGKTTSTMLCRLEKKLRRCHLTVARRFNEGNSGALIAAAVPWCYAHFVLHYWSTWYDSMRGFGDSAGVWTGALEEFFYFLATLAIGRHIDAAVTDYDKLCSTVKSISSRTSTGKVSTEEQKQIEKQENLVKRTPWFNLLNLKIFIVFSVAGVAFFCENMVQDNALISIPLLTYLLWSVS